MHITLSKADMFIFISSCIFGYETFILSNLCFAFGLHFDQCQSGIPVLTDRPRSCEKGEVWGAALSPELKNRLGASARRGSAPVIDTRSVNHISGIHTQSNHSQRSMSLTPIEPEVQPALTPSELHSEAEDGLPPQSTPPVPQVSPVCPHTEYRRLSDTSIRQPSEAKSENFSAHGGRRHSDLSSLLSLSSHHNHHFAMHHSQVCQACLSLLLLRSQEGNHRRPSVVMPAHLCPCDFRQHPFCSGARTNPSYGRLKSDCSDFSLLQQSLFKIISRKAAPCQTAAAQAAHRPSCNDGDGSLKSHLLVGSSAAEQDPLQNCEDRFCAGEQQVTRAMGVVGHNSSRVSLVTRLGCTPA